MIYIGIDPGLDGAMAFLNDQSGVLTIVDMPTFEITRGGSKKREIDVYKLCDELRYIETDKRVMLEHSQAYKGEGASSSHRNGVNWGVVYGSLIAMKFPIAIVTAAVWKRAMKASSDKDLSRRLACEAFPNYTNQFGRKKDHNRAEAALLALYARYASTGLLPPRV